MGTIDKIRLFYYMSMYVLFKIKNYESAIEKYNEAIVTFYILSHSVPKSVFYTPIKLDALKN